MTKIRKNIINNKFGVDFLLLLVMLFYIFLPQIHQFSVGEEHHCVECSTGFSVIVDDSITLPHSDCEHHHHDSEVCPICSYFNSPFAVFLTLDIIDLELFNDFFNNTIFVDEIVCIKTFVNEHNPRSPPHYIS